MKRTFTAFRSFWTTRARSECGKRSHPSFSTSCSHRHPLAWRATTSRARRACWTFQVSHGGSLRRRISRYSLTRTLHPTYRSPAAAICEKLAQIAGDPRCRRDGRARACDRSSLSIHPGIRCSALASLFAFSRPPMHRAPVSPEIAYRDPWTIIPSVLDHSRYSHL
jgi:hypothetical protein